MTKRFHSTPSNKSHPHSRPASPLATNVPRRLPLWQAVLLPLLSILIFFLLLEGGLALFGVRPSFRAEDPFVGFADDLPLYVPTADGRQMTTAPNKRSFFNVQSFPRQKTPGTFRIFCLGGSTTFGHPYADPLSFAGWMRELLPVADKTKHWEVINAGGISYASYRVAHLMEELVRYQPDLFIVYTGHNEFLEERTYGQLRNMPAVVRQATSLLARTRSWTAMSAALHKLGINPQKSAQGRSQLRGEVDAILDRSAGLNRYTRDDALRDNILRHYRISLERMVSLARSAEAPVIFVTPASNLKDFTPFKSEHTEGLDVASQQRAEQMLAAARDAMRRKDWSGAFGSLDQALTFDPRHAELLYRRGQVLVALGRFDEAESVLRQARDEDVCPLRALSPMPRIVAEVARDKGAELVDYVELLRQRMRDRFGHPVLGQEYFLDHVHPTIEGYRMLAIALIDAMNRQGLVQQDSAWGEQAIAAVAKEVEGRIDPGEQGRALVTVARVLLWAGKSEDAERLAKQALAVAGDVQDVAADINTVLVRIYQKQGQPERALELLYQAIEKAPTAVELRYMLGTIRLEDGPFMQLEEAAANLLLACRKRPYDDLAFQYFGLAMAKRGRLRITHSSLVEAVRLNPNNITAQKALDQIPQELEGQRLDSEAPELLLDAYPSQAPRKLAQIRRGAGGRSVPDGIVVEWYENGRLSRFLDVDYGVPNGLDIIWRPDGRVSSWVALQNGKRVESSARH